MSDGYLEGAPELVVEVSASSASIDLHDKLRAYRRNGVQEYVVWRTRRRIDWFELADGEYRLLPADDAGVVRSRVFPGLRIACRALLAGDLAAALAELQKGIGSDEHRRFIARPKTHDLHGRSRPSTTRGRRRSVDRALTPSAPHPRTSPKASQHLRHDGEVPVL